MAKGWHVLYVRSRFEKKMSEHCRIRKVKHYLPLRREQKIYQRRYITVEKPLFPGYVFANISGDARRIVLKTNFIIRIIAPDNERQLLYELAQIRKALAVDPSLVASAKLKKGRKVRIIGGPFLGVEGTVALMRENSKVRLNVEIIGQAVPIDVRREYLEVID